MWHCPHCGAPQAESARCWVCRRSSTTCSTCRHFRTSLKAEIGWCALDPKRLPLTGLEQRGCWQEQTAAGGHSAPGPGAEGDRRPRTPAVMDDASAWKSPARDFVPVELVGVIAITGGPSDSGTVEPTPIVAPMVVEPEPAWVDRTSLFGELET